MSTAIAPKRTKKSKATSVNSESVSAETTTETERAIADRVEGIEEVRMIPLDQVDRHPQNRKISKESVADLAESIRQFGQREPGRVRRHPNGRYELLSGERRYRACQAAGLETFKSVVVVIDDAAALAEVALGNASRKDLDPIERAELLEHLLAPIDDGGAGMTRSEAGKLFGLESNSGVKNAVRLLKLPPFIKSLVRDGELPERLARKVIPYCEIPAVADAIDEDFKRVFDLKTRDEYEYTETIAALAGEREIHFLDDFIRDRTRPMDPDVTEYLGYGKGNRRMGFSPTEEELHRLCVKDTPVGKRAENVELWDSLNKPFEQETTKPGSKGAAATGKDKKALTPAEQKKVDREKAKKAEDQLNRFTNDWLRRLIRCTLATTASEVHRLATLPWLCGECHTDVSGFATLALEELGVTPQLDELHATKQFMNDKRSTAIASELWRLLMWPVSNRLQEKKPSKKRIHYGANLTPIGELPENLPGYMDLETLVDLFKLCDTSIDDAWKAATVDGSSQRALLEVWLKRHTKAQLHNLRTELNVTEGGEHMGRDELVGCVMNAHRPGKPLGIPNRLCVLVTGCR